MKRIFSLALVVIMLLSFAACGGKSGTADSQSGDTDQIQSEETSHGQNSASQKAGDIKGILCAGYDAYNSSWMLFCDYVTEQSSNQEVVAVNHGMVMPLELKNLNYLIPLSFMGQSLMNMGKSDPDMESGMLKVSWADDAALTYDRNEGYQEYVVKGTGADGSMLEIKARYDDDTDSLRMEGYKDGNLDMLFEYSRMPEGYAAQYHYKAIVGIDKGQSIEGLCTFKMTFAGSSGSCSRFDNVSSEPDSIFGRVPNGKTFIEGASHWFTLSNGKFTGDLNGTTF